MTKESKGNSVSGVSHLLGDITALSLSMGITQPVVSAFSLIGAQMTSRQTPFFQTLKQMTARQVAAFPSRMNEGLKRRIATFSVPFPMILHSAKAMGIENSFVVNSFATIVETSVAMGPYGGEVAERFGLVNSRRFQGITGNLFKMSSVGFNSQIKNISSTQRKNCGSYQDLESLRRVSNKNFNVNATALALRNFSFFTAVAVDNMVNGAIENGTIEEYQRVYYERAGRFVASTMSVVPDALFSFTSSGQMQARDVLNKIPQQLVRQARNLPIVPRIITCYISAVAANWGFEHGGDLEKLWNSGIDMVTKFGCKDRNVPVEIDVDKQIKDIESNTENVLKTVKPRNENEESFLNFVRMGHQVQDFGVYDPSHSPSSNSAQPVDDKGKEGRGNDAT